MKALKLLVLVLISISTGATYAQNAISGRVTDTREKPITNLMDQVNTILV